MFLILQFTYLYDFPIFTGIYASLHWFIVTNINLNNDQLPVACQHSW